MSILMVTNGGSDALFDDCEICRVQKHAMQEGRAPTMEELKAAFQKAKDQGGMVGGEWFEEKRIPE